jgi:hypothetical protein
MAPHPDFVRLLAEAQANRRPVSLDHARRSLGGLFNERDLANETLVLRGAEDIALTATAWIRIVKRAQEKQGRP